MDFLDTPKYIKISKVYINLIVVYLDKKAKIFILGIPRGTENLVQDSFKTESDDEKASINVNSTSGKFFEI